MTEDKLKHIPSSLLAQLCRTCSGGYLEYPQNISEQGIEDFTHYLHCTIVNEIHIQIISL